MGEAGAAGDRTGNGQLERINPLTCEQCGGEFEAKNRNGLRKRFCCRACKTVWHNRERLRLFKKTNQKKTGAAGRCRTSIKTLDQLAAAEGLPPGCYPPGALGLRGRRRRVIEVIPAAERPALLAEAARRLGLTSPEAA